MLVLNLCVECGLLLYCSTIPWEFVLIFGEVSDMSLLDDFVEIEKLDST